MSLANWNIGTKLERKITPTRRRSTVFVSRSAGSLRVSAHSNGGQGKEPGRRPSEDAASRSKHQLAGKLTTNTYAWDASQAEMKQTWKWTNHYIHIYARRGNSYRKMAHCNQYFCCLYRTVYNKKRSIYKTKTHCRLSIWFFFFSHLKRSKNILFY